MTNDKAFIALIKLTLQEILGQRIYRLMMTVALLLPWLLLVPASLFLIDIGKVVLDLHFTGQHAWLAAYVFFIATPLLARDMEMGIASIFLTLPMSRHRYYAARILGLIAGIFPLLAIYVASSALSILWAAHTWHGYVPERLWIPGTEGLLLIIPPYLALLGALFFIASRATGAAETSVFLFAVWLLCWSIPPVLEGLQNPEVAKRIAGWIPGLLRSIQQLLPDLSSSQISLMLAHQASLRPVQILGYCIHHFAYATLAWLAGAMLFARRDMV